MKLISLGLIHVFVALHRPAPSMGIELLIVREQSESGVGCRDWVTGTGNRGLYSHILRFNETLFISKSFDARSNASRLCTAAETIKQIFKVSKANMYIHTRKLELQQEIF